MLGVFILIIFCIIASIIGFRFKKPLLSLGVCLLFLGIYLFYDDYSYGVELSKGVETELVDKHIIEMTSQPKDNKKSDKSDTSKKKVDKKKVYKNVLEIPDLNLTAPILPDISRDSLRKGVGLYPDTKGLGEKGNCVIAGHSSMIYNCVFDPLHDIELGAEIFVYDENSKKYKYIVTEINKSIEPTDLSVLESKDLDNAYLTLLTCTDYGRKRFTVVAKMEDKANERKSKKVSKK